MMQMSLNLKIQTPNTSKSKLSLEKPQNLPLCPFSIPFPTYTKMD